MPTRCACSTTAAPACWSPAWTVAYAPAWSAPLPFAGASAHATSATSTRLPAIEPPISAAAPPFTVAWYKWKEAETDDTHTIVRTPRRGAPVLLPAGDGPGAGAHRL